MKPELSLEEMCKIGLKVKNWKIIDHKYWDYKGSIKDIMVYSKVIYGFRDKIKKASLRIDYGKHMLGYLNHTKDSSVIAVAKYAKGTSKEYINEEFNAGIKRAKEIVVRAD